ncbi:E3 ubiquitin-protein ligase TRIM56-like [Saccostrea cucullata]|uniref:E3 ubiquitin-protein ligase TRIM56-like n=1 Tax=Saccostrea cuccullata TaxID=36930 RepID=UPI002ECFB794
MASISTSFTDDFLRCSICFEIYKEPQILPCLHSFCKGCILNFTQTESLNRQFNCPLCREPFSTNEAGLKTNFFLQNMIDEITKMDSTEIFCSFCKLLNENELAVSQCITCLDYLCKKCSKSRHTFTRQTKDHKVVSLQDIKAGKYNKELRSAQKTPCLQHSDEKLRYFCIQCNLSVCRDCIIFNHRNHDFKLISDARKEKEEQITKVISPLREKVEILKKNDAEIGRKMEDIVSRESIIKAEIEKVYKEAMKCIDMSHKNVLKELTERMKLAKGRLQLVRDKSDEVTSNIEESINLSVAIINRGDDVEVLSVLDDIIERLTTLNNSEVIQECQVPSVDIPNFQIKWEEPHWILSTSENAIESERKPKTSLTQPKEEKPMDPKENTTLSETNIAKMSAAEKYFATMPKARRLAENMDTMQGKLSLSLIKVFVISEEDEKRNPIYSSVAWISNDRLIAIDKENCKIKMLTLSSGEINSVKVKNALGIVTSKCLLACRTTDSDLIFFDLDLKEQNKIKDVMTVIPHDPDKNTLAWMSKNKIFIKTEKTVTEKDLLDNKGNKTSLCSPKYACALPNNIFVISDWGDDCVYFLDEGFKIIRKIDTYPGSIAFDSKTNVYITDYHNNCLFLFNTKGDLITQLKLGKDQSSPRSIAILKDKVLVAGKGKICMYDIQF